MHGGGRTRRARIGVEHPVGLVDQPGRLGQRSIAPPAAGRQPGAVWRTRSAPTGGVVPLANLTHLRGTHRPVGRDGRRRRAGGRRGQRRVGQHDPIRGLLGGIEPRRLAGRAPLRRRPAPRRRRRRSPAPTAPARWPPSRGPAAGGAGPLQRRLIQRHGLLQHDGELVPAVPHREVLGTNVQADDATDLPQHVVAHPVAVHVVDLLEVVEVDEQQRGGGLAAHRTGQPRLEGAPVLQSGQHIGRGVRGQAPVVGLQPLQGDDRNGQPPGPPCVTATAAR